jgi:IMP and pyridine-specific 5'-nucleotidase
VFTPLFFAPNALLLSSSPEWIKGLLAVPFVLYSQPTGALEGQGIGIDLMKEEAHRRYGEILKDVEAMIDDHSKARS